MSDKISTFLTESELKIIEALRDSPQLENCFLEMVDIANSPLGKLDIGDDAEEAVVETIQKTGRVILEKWAQQKSDQITTKTQREAGVQLHGKKKFPGKHP